MKFLLLTLLLGSTLKGEALVISEIMSNPIGDDNGREWVEIYNNENTDVDVSSLTVSIKGANPIVVTPLSGGTMLPAGGYAIIGSTVSGSTKFLQDYATYSGMLFKSSISLVNTGVTSIDIRISGQVVNALGTYTAAKEGSTLSLINGSFVQAAPTPGSANASTSGEVEEPAETSIQTTQVTVAKQVPPAPDIVVHLPFEKIAVAGAPVRFSAYGTNREDKPINDLRFAWAFGDGGEATGSSTVYRYAYPGRYIAHVEARNNNVYGVGTSKVHVVAPEISVKAVGTGKYGAYVDIENAGAYDVDVSDWRLVFDGIPYVIPRNTILAGQTTTRLSGAAMGFASTTLWEGSSVALIFPNQERVAHLAYKKEEPTVLGTTTEVRKVEPFQPKIVPIKKPVPKAATTTLATTTVKAPIQIKKKDTRIVSFFRSLFGQE